MCCNVAIRRPRIDLAMLHGRVVKGLQIGLVRVHTSCPGDLQLASKVILLIISWWLCDEEGASERVRTKSNCKCIEGFKGHRMSRLWIASSSPLLSVTQSLAVSCRVLGHQNIVSPSLLTDTALHPTLIPSLSPCYLLSSSDAYLSTYTFYCF